MRDICTLCVCVHVCVHTWDYTFVTNHKRPVLLPINPHDLWSPLVTPFGSTKLKRRDFGFET